MSTQIGRSLIEPQADASSSSLRGLASAKRRVALLRWLERTNPLLHGVLRTLKGYTLQLVPLEYRVENSKPRYGYSRPPHVELMRRCEFARTKLLDVLDEFQDIRDVIASIPAYEPASTVEPFWYNTWFPVIDAILIMGFLALRKPKRYLEIGSGHSTRFARHVVRAKGLTTTITSIDPFPRAQIDQMCDRIVRAPLGECDLSLFDELEAGDILSFDGSHRVFVDSDVTIFFLEVLPRIKRGVHVHVHDIFLPYDYPPGNPYYSEQYVLATYLLANEESQIEFPAYFSMRDDELRNAWRGLLRGSQAEVVDLEGYGFWFTT